MPVESSQNRGAGKTHEKIRVVRLVSSSRVGNHPLGETLLRTGKGELARIVGEGRGKERKRNQVWEEVFIVFRGGREGSHSLHSLPPSFLHFFPSPPHPPQQFTHFLSLLFVAW